VKRCLLVFALLAASAFVAPASASAVIQLDQGIGGVRLDNTAAQVRTALGKPDQVRRGRNTFGRFTRYSYTPESITVIFQGGSKVTSVATEGVGDRTTRAVGVGSRERTVDQRVRGVKCETIARIRSCHTGDFRPGRRVTDFLIRRGRVTRVTVGIVID
jgi:hypothetical protein